MSVLVETSLGDLVIDLEVTSSPQAAKNFLKLCKVKAFNNRLFFRVEKGYIARTGDPTDTGEDIGSSIHTLLRKSSNGKSVAVALERSNALKHNRLGTVSMLCSGEDDQRGGGSQFYITLRPNIDYLDGNHTIFGVVEEGAEVLEKLNTAVVDEDFRPLFPIRIRHTIILDDPFEDPEGLEDLIPVQSPAELLDEEVKVFESVEDEVQVIEKIAKNEAKSRAIALEILGDLPDADVKPPDNVLFVCKLNPITVDEDLELIFARFGQIRSCEIIRDWKSGDSLQYGFIEFDDPAACESAYFKMQNALIDDRRIHVDFCQSVAQHWRNFKRRGARGGTREEAQDVAQIAAKGRGEGAFPSRAAARAGQGGALRRLQEEGLFVGGEERSSLKEKRYSRKDKEKSYHDREENHRKIIRRSRSRSDSRHRRKRRDERYQERDHHSYRR